jgi:tetratricopeptide (TPR) repeat protein
MAYRPTLMDRLGPDAAEVYRALAYSVPVALLMAVIGFAQLRYLGALVALLAGLLVFLATCAVAVAFALLVGHGAGSAARAVTNPSGAATPPVADYSYEKALVMKGQLEQALHSYERRLAEHPDAVPPRLLAADLYVRQGQAHRALDLLEAARAGAAAGEAERLHATNQLIDLYLGPLDRPDLARRELRFLIRAFPGSQAAEHAKAALKTGMGGGQSPNP